MKLRRLRQLIQERELSERAASIGTGPVIPPDGTDYLDQLYPDTGPLRRELYRPHQEFFTAGKTYRERLMLAANRIGKTEGIGGYEVVRHMIGEYPPWWNGRVFLKPPTVWIAGDTSHTVREILQNKLLGPVTNIGSGLLPRRSLLRTTPKRGNPDSIQDFYVRHSSGGVSVATFKSYDQGFASFQGADKDIIWLDEEPDLNIYTECLTRTMTTNGIVICTFTPLLGLSEVVLLFLPGGKLPDPPKQIRKSDFHQDTRRS